MAGEITLARALDLDHPGAEVSQLTRRERCGDRVFDRDHGDAREGQRGSMGMDDAHGLGNVFSGGSGTLIIANANAWKALSPALELTSGAVGCLISAPPHRGNR
jgi:hypothetical protein